VPAYLIANIDVTESAQYEEYKQMAAPTVVAHGGRYLVRGGTAERLTGDWAPRRIVVLEFPSMEQAKAWWTSTDYAPAKALREQAARSEMILVEGM